MWTCDRLRELIEEWLLNLGKLCGIHDFEDIFHFVKEHNLFRTVDFRPVSQQPKNDLFKRQSGSSQIRGQRRTSSVKAASFSRNCTMQYANCGWYMLKLLTLWRGINTLVRKSLCSSLRGSANPLMIEPRISKSSAMPLNLSVSYMNWKKTLFIDRRMYERRFRNFPYIRCRVVFRKSRSRGSSESKSSRSLILSVKRRV